MIEYVIAENPDSRIIEKICEKLRSGEIIIFPTDSSWVMAVNPFHKGAVDKIYKMKGEEKSHHFSLVCLNISMADELALIPDDVFRLIRNKVPGHYTFIFSATKIVTKALKASKTDHEVGIRFVPSKLVNSVLEQFNGPLLTTNLTNEMLNISETDEIYSYLIEEEVGNQVGAIIDPGEYEFRGTSTIYNFASDRRECIREGAGKLLF
jgi:tRNA threonylcarbamoyl adenosine modification protein (Sua5/YciO/YrdC/YwlC family)